MSRQRTLRRRTFGSALLLVLVLACISSCATFGPLAGPAGSQEPSALSLATPTPKATSAPGASATKTPKVATPGATAQPPAGLAIATPPAGERIPTIRYEQLPPQAHETLRLIAGGGPFPYRQDGVEFQNRERLLPIKPARYYKEYTVVTPGSADRGARRIIAGQQGELYYTADHYASFQRVIP